MSQSQNSEELSRLAAEMRVFNQSHSHLLEQNQRLMESNAELQKKILQLTKDAQEMKQEMKLHQTRTLNQTPAAPAAAFPAPAIVMPTLATPAHATSRGFVSTPERGIKNMTPPMTMPGLSPFTGRPTKPLGTAKPSKVSPQPQGMVKQNTCNRQRLALMTAAQPVSALGLNPFAGTPSKPLGTAKPSKVSSQPQGMIKQDTSDWQRLAMMAFLPATTASQPKTQLTGFTPSIATTKPNQTFSKFSFSPSSVNPAPSFAKPVTSSANLCRPVSSTSLISTAGFFKLAPPTKASLQPPAGGSSAVFSKPNLTQDASSSSPTYPGFYTSQKALPGMSLQVDQTVPSSRRLGQSPLAKGAVSPKTAKTTKSVSFKAEVEEPSSSMFGASGGSRASFGSLSISSPGGSVFRGGDSGSGISFATLAANQSGGFGWQFGKRCESEKNYILFVIAHSTIGGEVNPEEERDFHFQQIVKLPDNVDLVTGEEQEVAVFVGRGKLYRFDGGARQWKERGVGDIKIMKEEETNVYRIVMRRDQIHKVCANHYITSSMALHPMSSSDRAWVWYAMDAADGEPTSEQLAIKFKDSSIAASFKEKFEEAQAKIRLREYSCDEDVS